MKREEALNLIKQVCEQFRGTLKDHQLLQEAIKVLSEEPKPKEK